VTSEEIEYETDRLRFLGRGRTPANPAALDFGSRLSRTTGPVLDPIFALRRRVSLDAGRTARLAFVTGAADTYEAAVGIAERFRAIRSDRPGICEHVRSQRELRELELSPQDIALFDRLAASVVFTNSASATSLQ
jgi:cellobiose phosphorylase